MLMFTMGINVFAAENVEGTPGDDPAVTLDEDGVAALEEGDDAVTDVAPADEAVVQEEAPEVKAKGDEITAKSGNIAFETIINNQNMFNVTVTAAGNGNYKAASVTRTITVNVK